MSAHKPNGSMDSLKSNSEPKEPKRPEALTEEIKHKLKLIEKAFR